MTDKKMIRRQALEQFPAENSATLMGRQSREMEVNGHRVRLSPCRLEIYWEFNTRDIYLAEHVPIEQYNPDEPFWYWAYMGVFPLAEKYNVGSKESDVFN